MRGKIKGYNGRRENKSFRRNIFSFLFFQGELKMRENKFQSDLIKELKNIFPGCVIVKNDPNYIQGIPDLLILFNNRWAALECKKEKTAKHRPNQDYYVEHMNDMSYASFIYPENKEDVINELQSALRAER